MSNRADYHFKFALHTGGNHADMFEMIRSIPLDQTCEVSIKSNQLPQYLIDKLPTYQPQNLTANRGGVVSIAFQEVWRAGYDTSVTDAVKALVASANDNDSHAALFFLDPTEDGPMAFGVPTWKQIA